MNKRGQTEATAEPPRDEPAIPDPTAKAIEQRLKELAASDPAAVVTLELVCEPVGALAQPATAADAAGRTWEQYLARWLRAKDSACGRVVGVRLDGLVEVECQAGVVPELRTLGLAFDIVRLVEAGTEVGRQDALSTLPTGRAHEVRRSLLLQGVEQAAGLRPTPDGEQYAALLAVSVRHLAGTADAPQLPPELTAWVDASGAVIQKAGLAAAEHLRPSAAALAKGLLDKAVADLGASGYMMCVRDPQSEDDYRIVLAENILYPEMVSGFNGFGSAQWDHAEAERPRKRDHAEAHRRRKFHPAPAPGDVVCCSSQYTALEWLPMNRWFRGEEGRSQFEAYRKLMKDPAKRVFGAYYVRERLEGLAYLDGRTASPDQRCLSVYLNFQRKVVFGNRVRAYLRGLRADLVALYPQFRREFCVPIDSRLPARLLRTSGELASLGESKDATFEQLVRDGFRRLRDAKEPHPDELLRQFLSELAPPGAPKAECESVDEQLRLFLKSPEPAKVPPIRRALEGCFRRIPWEKTDAFEGALRDCLWRLRGTPDALRDGLQQLAGQNANGPPVEPYSDAVAVCLRRFLENVLGVLGLCPEGEPVKGFATLDGFNPATYMLYPVAKAGDINSDKDKPHMNPHPAFAGRGVVSWVALHRRPILIPNVADPRLSELVLTIDVRVRSELAVPMFAGDDLIGVLNVECFEPAAFTHAHLVMLSLVANAVAVAWRGCLRRRMVVDLAGLYGVPRHESVRERTRRWFEQTRDTFRADAGLLWLVNAAARPDESPFVNGLGPDARSPLPRRDKWTDRVRNTQRVVCLTGLRFKDEFWNPLDYTVLVWDEDSRTRERKWVEPDESGLLSGLRPDILLNQEVVGTKTLCLIGIPLLRAERRAGGALPDEPPQSRCLGVLWLEYHHVLVSSIFNSPLIRDSVLVPVLPAGAGEMPTETSQCRVAFNPEYMGALEAALNGSLPDLLLSS